MEKAFEVIIVGGGASGLTCAVDLTRGQNAFCGEDILLLEKLDRVGKKILATGNGQCNITNQNMSEDCFHGEKEFVKVAVKNIIDVDICSYFYSLGIPLCEYENGKVYPISKQANSVLDGLRFYLENKGVNIKTSCHVLSIKKRDDLFEVKTRDCTFLTKKVVLAVGGKAQKQFGTDGSSYILSQNFGHKITQLYPSLVQLKTESGKIKGLKGIKENAVVCVYDGDKKIREYCGDVLFTEFGISGNAIFSASAYLTDIKNPKVVLSFIPYYTIEQTEKLVADKMKNFVCGDKSLLLNGILNKMVGKAVLMTAKNFTPKDIAFAIKNFSLTITGNLGFDYAQVTKGGVETKFVDKNTYQSLLTKNLYIVGEQLDIDGDCGGYNLSFAIASAIKASNHIKLSK